jgi:hypothetical protein
MKPEGGYYVEYVGIVLKVLNTGWIQRSGQITVACPWAWFYPYMLSTVTTP